MIFIKVLNKKLVYILLINSDLYVFINPMSLFKLNKLCNKVILTNDNPREEDPKNITKQIFQSVKKAEVIHNRKLAIKKGIKITKKNEVLLIAGKGHENYQIFKNKIIYFSDFDVAKKNLFI